MCRVRIIALLLTACLIATAVTSSHHTAAAPSPQKALGLPTGFVSEPVATGLRSPRDVAFAPDGRIFIAERGNATSGDINVTTIRVWQDGILLPPSADHWFNVCGDGERGLLGLTIDPQFATNGYVYVYYTRPGIPYNCGYNLGAGGPRNRVSRVTMGEKGVVPDSEKVLVDNITADGGIHNAGDLLFDSAGNLYISTGNGNMTDDPAPKTSALGGKILRIRPDAALASGYSIPAGNPFATASGARLCGTTPPAAGDGPCKEVFAFGLRNPFRMAIHPSTDALYAFDVGGGGWEELNAVQAGANYGYPSREGPCEGGSLCLATSEFFGPTTGPEGYTNPLYSYSHAPFNGSTDAAIIGGAVYTGAGYPAQYVGSIFFADLVRGWVRRVSYNNVAGQWERADFASGLPGVVGMQVGFSKDIYYLQILDENDGTLNRIRYTGALNQPPVAQISASPLSGPVNTIFTFSGAASSDPEGHALTYRWQFGDGATAETSTSTTTHTYSSAGVKQVTLTVVDDGTPSASSAPAQIAVFPGNSPPAGMIALVNNTSPGRPRFYAGDTWAFSAVGLADNQTPMDQLDVSWRVAFHHREHSHPFIEEVGGSQGTFSIPTIGETDTAVWYRVHLRITDAEGLSTEITRDIMPAVASITLKTNLPGGTLQVDGKNVVTPLTFSRLIGQELLVSAPAERTLSKIRYGFVGWSNGASRQFVLRTPAAGGSYTASFQPKCGAPVICVSLPLIRR